MIHTRIIQNQPKTIFQTYKIQYVISKLLYTWMISIIILIAIISRYANATQQKFYKFGPNETLTILGLSINTWEKYIGVALYCFINSIMRTLMEAIIRPWIINNIQDESKIKYAHLRCFSYEMTFVNTSYLWFDFFIYMSILFSQIDMLLIEVIADLCITFLTTTYYVKQNSNITLQQQLINNIQNDNHIVIDI
jgi:hypothetical protein